MLKKSLLFIVSFLLLGNLSANAIELHFNGFIADEANLLPEQVEKDLNMTLWDLQKKSGADIAVVTLPTLNGKTVEEVALDIGRTYKLGAVGKNNGMVFLTALSERRVRIELGLGLEDKISMYTMQNIINNDVVPYYKNGDYTNGVTRGAYVLAKTVAIAEGVSNLNIQGTCPPSLSSSSDNSSSSKDGHIPWWAYPFLFLAALFRGRRRSGSFGGFGGGGGFGGSGCSGSW